MSKFNRKKHCASKNTEIDFGSFHECTTIECSVCGTFIKCNLYGEYPFKYKEDKEALEECYAVAVVKRKNVVCCSTKCLELYLLTPMLYDN